MSTSSRSSGAAHALFGQTRCSVLALLFGHPDERFYFREIMRALGSGSGGVQRELHQLVEAGLVVRVKEGRQVYFSANPEAPIFADLRAIIRKTVGAVDVLRHSLAPLLKRKRIAVAFLYGSIVTGNETARSDIDLVVIGEATLADVVPALRSAERRLRGEVNPSIYPVPEFRKNAAIKGSFVARLIGGPKLFVAGDADELARLGH